jgi:hypothetical protein
MGRNAWLLTNIVCAEWNQVVGGILHRLEIRRCWILDIPDHEPSETVFSRGHCEGEEGGGQETRGAEVKCYDLTL